MTAYGSVKISFHTFIWLFLLVQIGLANVEKIIFTASPPLKAFSSDLTLGSLNIPILTNDQLSFRTQLGRASPSKTLPSSGELAWVLLTNLTEHQRYELRLCWSALEPTHFAIEAFEIEKVLGNPELMQSLNAYSALRNHGRIVKRSTGASSTSPISLFVGIQAVADYYTDDKDLMANPPPVLVDVILDPFLANILPQSLLPNVGYLTVIGITAWFMAQWIVRGLRSVSSSAVSQIKKLQ